MGVFDPGPQDILATIQIGLIAENAIKKALPVAEEEISVTVWGGPTATRKSLYRLAMAIVWGKIQRVDLIRALPPAGFVKLEYNLEQKSVNVTARIVTTYIAALLGRVRGARHWEVFGGPAESVVGGEWAFNSILPGLPGAPGGMDLKNGWEGKTLITPDASFKGTDGQFHMSRSPTPPGDRLSRGLATIAHSPAAKLLDPTNWNNTPEFLLWAMLSEPCAVQNYNTPVYATVPLGYFPVPSPSQPRVLTTTDNPFAPPTSITVYQADNTAPHSISTPPTHSVGPLDLPNVSKPAPSDPITGPKPVDAGDVFYNPPS